MFDRSIDTTNRQSPIIHHTSYIRHIQLLGFQVYLGAYVILELASHWVWNPLIAVRKHLPFNTQLLFSLFSIIIANWPFNTQLLFSLFSIIIANWPFNTQLLFSLFSIIIASCRIFWPRVNCLVSSIYCDDPVLVPSVHSRHLFTFLGPIIIIHTLPQTCPCGKTV